MNIRYDKAQDTLYIDLAQGNYDKTKKISDSILVDIDKDNSILGIEILDASQNIKHFDSSKLSPVIS